MQKVNFLGGNSEYDAYVPKENVRIKMSGSGEACEVSGRIVQIEHYQI